MLYLGVSDTPAWIVSKANQYAWDFGLRQFVVYQGEWSARSFQCVRMSRWGLCPWGALRDGKFKSDEDRREGEGRGAGEVSEQQIKVSAALGKLAKEKGVSITGVALAYVMHKASYVLPTCGGRKTDHLKGNIDALALSLSDEEMAEIDNAWPFDVGFPLSFLSQTPAGAKRRDVALSRQSGWFDYVEARRWITWLVVIKSNSQDESRTNSGPVKCASARSTDMAYVLDLYDKIL